MTDADRTFVRGRPLARVEDPTESALPSPAHVTITVHPEGWAPVLPEGWTISYDPGIPDTTVGRWTATGPETLAELQDLDPYRSRFSAYPWPYVRTSVTHHDPREVLTLVEMQVAYRADLATETRFRR